MSTISTWMLLIKTVVLAFVFAACTSYPEQVVVHNLTDEQLQVDVSMPPVFVLGMPTRNPLYSTILDPAESWVTGNAGDLVKDPREELFQRHGNLFMTLRPPGKPRQQVRIGDGRYYAVRSRDPVSITILGIAEGDPLLHVTSLKSGASVEWEPPD
jgi:hypothetical protein